MTDENGIEIKTGDVVVITGAYFKNDNARYRVARSPGDENWLGKDYSLKRINRDGTDSKSKYNQNFWPLSAMTNDWRKNHDAKIHNAENAKIEVIPDAPSGIIPIKKGGVKFLWNGVKVDGVLHTCWYSAGPYNERSQLPAGTITIRAKTYSDLPAIEGISVENNSDTQTDYFEKDTMRIFPGSRYYPDAKAACEKAEARQKARFENKYGKTA